MRSVFSRFRLASTDWTMFFRLLPRRVRAGLEEAPRVNFVAITKSSRFAPMA
jgi:hypothetical protein